MWPKVDALFALVAVTAVGWLWGSFLNLTVDRTPRLGDPPPPPGTEPPTPLTPLTALSPLRPARSLCLSCRRPLAWYDNLPIVSYLWLGGRCRACGVAIGRRTLVLESMAPLGFLAWWLGAGRAGMGWPWAVWGLAVLSWLLVAAALAWERRRPGRWFLVLGMVLAAGVVALARLRLP
jgi:leader peptidase (prepilin peptidase)/N-methyltransferase